MWSLAVVDSPFAVWCSDGMPINTIRGGNGESARFIIDKQGFLDVTELNDTTAKSVELIDHHLNSTEVSVVSGSGIDVNGLSLDVPEYDQLDSPLALYLRIEIGKFILGISNATNASGAASVSWPNKSVRGALKPLPKVLDEDAAYMDCMMATNHVPYAKTRDLSTKQADRIRALGKKFFPFSPHSFQLAMSVHDWTTASFSRLVLLKMFQYTGYTCQDPAPIDQYSIAKAIWTSSWETYTAQDPDFMASFLMTPAWSFLEVKQQLLNVRKRLQRFAETENRILSAAMQSLPRTSISSKPQLFSGQLDMSQLGTEDFGISLKEAPANKGPISKPLQDNLQHALSTYAAEGKTITTKNVWSFTDNVESAASYTNGILLIANFPELSNVWDTFSYITPLSLEPEKIEYTVLPGSQFIVGPVGNATVMGKELVVITLQPKI